MIVIEFNSNGYSIVGEGIEIKLSCSPTKFYDQNELLYIILIKALIELKNKKVDIICYNDSRIIDEINGSIKTMSGTSEDLRKMLIREIIPKIKGIVFFRKRSINIEPIKYNIPPIVEKEQDKNSLIEKFKNRWFKK